MKRYATGVAVGALVLLAVMFRPARVLDTLRTAVASPWFPVFLVGLYAVRPFLGWPISLLSALVGFQYGLLVGVPIALAGAVATSVPPFAVGRYAPTEGRLFGTLTDGSQRYFRATGDLRGLVAARLAPTPPEAISGAAGAGGVGFGTFAAGTLLGELPWVVAAVALGSSLDAFTMDAANLDPAYLLAGVAAAAVLLIPVAYRTWKQRIA